MKKANIFSIRVLIAVPTALAVLLVAEYAEMVKHNREIEQQKTRSTMAENSSVKIEESKREFLKKEVEHKSFLQKKVVSETEKAGITAANFRGYKNIA